MTLNDALGNAPGLVSCQMQATAGVTGFGNVTSLPLNVTGSIPSQGMVTYTCSVNYDPLFGDFDAGTGCFAAESDPLSLQSVVSSQPSAGTSTDSADVTLTCEVVGPVAITLSSTTSNQSATITLMLLISATAILTLTTFLRRKPQA